MDHYGQIAMRYWSRFLPTRYAALEDPDSFFTDLGNQIQGQILGLIARLDSARLREIPAVSRQDYWTRVATLQTARSLAEEIVMKQLVWETAPELTLAEAREEWAQTTNSWEGLITWAERAQDQFDPPATIEIEATAGQWAIPAWFAEEMAAAVVPRRVFNAHPEIIAEATALRFLRELT